MASDRPNLATDRPGLAATAADEVLLRAFEPVVRFTEGELFLPTSVEGYVGHASLWADDPAGSTCLVEPGQLDLDRLVTEARAQRTTPLSLRFVERGLDRRAYKAWRRRPDRPRFRSASRFAQVGLTSRVFDALFRLALLLRGRVPGGWSAAAEVAYRTRLDTTHHPYYGRVTHGSGYVALQYWWFYAMNDWRSTFSGANDHEADWEQVTVFLAVDDTGSVTPAWVAMSAHDEVGADLRRRWDDPEIVRVGDHPVVHAAAGSHSCNVVAGDYVTAIVPSGWLRHVFDVLQAVARVLAPWSRGQIRQGLGIPFIDAARGDGVAIGPGTDRAWQPVVVDDHTPWVVAFKGLWGLDTRDRFGGERAPAGPRYERDGRVRHSWADPVGWAELHGVPPTPAERDRLLVARVEAIEAGLASIDQELPALHTTVMALTAEARSLRGRPGLGRVASQREADAQAARKRLDERVGDRSALALERTAHLDSVTHPPEPAPPHAHLNHRTRPIGERSDTRDRFLRAWSVVSTPLLFLATGLLLFDQSTGVLAGIGIFVVAFLGIEAIARRRFFAFLLTLALVTVGVLTAIALVTGLFEKWRPLVAGALAITGVVVLVANVRDIRRG